MPEVTNQGSRRFRLSMEDGKSSIRGFLIGLSGLALTYLTLKSNWVPTEYAPFLWVIYASLVNIARKFLADNSINLKGGLKQ
jgi:hypothetical protein